MAGIAPSAGDASLKQRTAGANPAAQNPSGGITE
jgi:hypothetical protein